MNPSEQIAEIIVGGGSPDATTLEAIFDELEPVAPAQMLGQWRGDSFNQDGAAAAMLGEMRWYGKRFNDAESVEPLLCRDEAGELYSYEKLGLARLREIAFRGKISAAMVYDTQPIIDHFRQIDADRLLGVMDVKGQPADFFFHLTRDGG